MRGETAEEIRVSLLHIVDAHAGCLRQQVHDGDTAARFPCHDLPVGQTVVVGVGEAFLHVPHDARPILPIRQRILREFLSRRLPPCLPLHAVPIVGRGLRDLDQIPGRIDDGIRIRQRERLVRMVEVEQVADERVNVVADPLHGLLIVGARRVQYGFEVLAFLGGQAQIGKSGHHRLL